MIRLFLIIIIHNQYFKRFLYYVLLYNIIIYWQTHRINYKIKTTMPILLYISNDFYIKITWESYHSSLLNLPQFPEGFISFNCHFRWDNLYIYIYIYIALKQIWGCIFYYYYYAFTLFKHHNLTQYRQFIKKIPIKSTGTLVIFSGTYFFFVIFHL